MKKTTIPILIALGGGLAIGAYFLLKKRIPGDYISYWKLKDNFNDEKGINNGTPVGAIITSDPERVSAASFDGTNYIDCGNDPSLDFTGGLTISMWVKTMVDIDYSTFMDKSPSYWWGTFTTARKLRGDLYIDGWDDLVAPDPMGLEVWHHIAMTFDGITQIIYQDGTEVNRQERIGNINISATPLSIGADPNYPHYFNGLINDFLIYGRPLNPDEIMQIYNSQK